MSTLEILPRGITGFYSAYFGTPPPSTEITAFKTVCYAVMRILRGHVVSIKQAGASGQMMNYHTAHVEHKSEEVYILCNAHYPYIAFTKKILFEGMRYIDHSELQEALQESALYTTLNSTYLHQYPNTELRIALEEVENKQIRFWQPRQVGDIIFNQWD